MKDMELFFATASGLSVGPTQSLTVHSGGSFPATKTAGIYIWPLPSDQCEG
jgi:hypothetical protein